MALARELDMDDPRTGNPLGSGSSICDHAAGERAPILQPPV